MVERGAYARRVLRTPVIHLPGDNRWKFSFSGRVFRICRETRVLGHGSAAIFQKEITKNKITVTPGAATLITTLKCVQRGIRLRKKKKIIGIRPVPRDRLRIVTPAILIKRRVRPTNSISR